MGLVIGMVCWAVCVVINGTAGTMKNKLPKKYIIWPILLLVFLPWQYLNLSGFCYKEKRYIPERELIDRYLSMQPLLNGKSRSLDDYPNCCKITLHSSSNSGIGILLNSIIFNLVFYEVVTYFPREDVSSHPKNSFYQSYGSIDSCGTQTIPGYGISMSREEYESYTNRNKTSSNK